MYEEWLDKYEYLIELGKNGEEIRRLNRELRATDKVTDVLSFPTLDGIKGEEICEEDYPYEIDEEGNLLIGSIAVCIEKAKEQAEEYGHSLGGGNRIRKRRGNSSFE